MGRLSALLKNPAALEAELAKYEAWDEDIEGDMAALSYANGVITAAIVSPEHIPESEWLPVAIGLCEDLSEDEAELARDTMRMEYSNVLTSLRSRKEDYEPFFWEDRDERTVTRDWAAGFVDGASLREEAWAPFLQDEGQYLFALVNVLLQDEEIDAKLSNAGADPEEVFEMAQVEIAALIQAAYSIRREQPSNVPGARTLDTKIGRNDPCPCGSGKKYKKCCLM